MLAWRLFLVCWVFTLAWAADYPTHNLVAYYTFDPTASALTPYSGICPPRTGSQAIIDGVPMFTNGITYASSRTAAFGNAAQWQATGSGNPGSASDRVELGDWTIASQLNQMTLSMWIFPTSVSANRGLIAKGNAGDFTKAVWALNMNNGKVGFYIVLNGASNSIVAPAALVVNTWNHVAGVYDGKEAILYINGKEVNSKAVTGAITEASQPIVLGNLNNKDAFTNNFQGKIDEVRIYNYALSPFAVESEKNATAPIAPPVLTSLTSNLNSSILVPLDLQNTISASSAITFQEWVQKSGECGDIVFTPKNQPDTTVSFAKIGSFDFSFVVYDSFLCSSLDFTVSPTADSPFFKANPPSTITIANGASQDLTLNVQGFPTPFFQWQQFSFITSAIGRSLENNNYNNRNNRNNNKYNVLPQFLMHHDVSPYYVRHMMKRVLNVTCSANVTVNCYDWVPIANQTTNTYSSPVATPAMNGTVIRLNAYNFVGSLFSNPITILVVASIPTSSSSSSSSGSSSSDDTTTILAAVLPSVLGALALCLCCCCVLIVLVLIVLFRRRAVGGKVFPGVEPDYEMVIFGSRLQSNFSIKSKQSSALKKFEQLLFQDEMFGLAFALAEAKKGDDSIPLCLSWIFYKNDKIFPLLETAIAHEVQRCNQPATMFRSNSFTSQLFKHFSLLVAAPYLWAMLASFIWFINEEAKELEGVDGDVEMAGDKRSFTKSKTDMEVDPTKMDEAADPKVNTLELWLTTQKIFSRIARSSDKIPEELGEVLHCVYETVAEKFPGEEYKAVGGFLFLRLICPALLAPQHYGVIEEQPLPTAQRQLILIAKVMQNLANETYPGAKEDYMRSLNEFITNNKDEMREYISKAIKADKMSKADRHVPDTAKNNALAELFNVLCNRHKEIKQTLANDYAEGDPIYEEIDKLLEFGPIQEN